MVYYEQQTTQQVKEQTLATQDDIDESYKFNKTEEATHTQKSIRYDSIYELKAAEAELLP